MQFNYTHIYKNNSIQKLNCLIYSFKLSFIFETHNLNLNTVPLGSIKCNFDCYGQHCVANSYR